MKLFPAIDLYGGKAVRLFKGDYNQMTVYNDNPLAVARDFAACGAENIHLVDLEGARSGQTPNLATVEQIAKESGLFCEVGGGIRSDETIRRYLEAGVSRVILGTAAVKDPDFLARSVAQYGEKIAVGVDLKDGYVAIHGWTQTSMLSCDAFMAQLDALGVQTVICTDISRDGAMKGTNHALYLHLKDHFRVNVIASGGVSSMEDVIRLKAAGAYGAIIGKAYYTGAIDLKKALEVSK
ncbi:MAG: 1-(5-phosphoribosyl)-5-[Clostridia bacterium]|nr:1-(5-phosphoribosyl)-5-[(5-phosphoribosylamino)methylideneamino]imidazole-4-carboxamide isomerase [Clostridia bacterium]